MIRHNRWWVDPNEGWWMFDSRQKNIQLMASCVGWRKAIEYGYTFQNTKANHEIVVCFHIPCPVEFLHPRQSRIWHKQLSPPNPWLGAFPWTPLGQAPRPFCKLALPCLLKFFQVILYLLDHSGDGYYNHICTIEKNIDSHFKIFFIHCI